MDASRNTALNTLDCGYNQLTGLDVRKCTNLYKPMCAGNNLITLDISGCPVLINLVENQEPAISYGRIQYNQGANCLEYKEGVTLITVPGSGPAPDFILPADLTTMETEAFAGGAFTYVLVPAGVERINNGTFANCPNLQYVEIQGADTVISPDAFGGRTDFTILGPLDSPAERWANMRHITFLAIA